MVGCADGEDGGRNGSGEECGNLRTGLDIWDGEAYGEGGDDNVFVRCGDQGWLYCRLSGRVGRVSSLGCAIVPVKLPNGSRRLAPSGEPSAESRVVCAPECCPRTSRYDSHRRAPTLPGRLRCSRAACGGHPPATVSPISPFGLFIY